MKTILLFVLTLIFSTGVFAQTDSTIRKPKNIDTADEDIVFVKVEKPRGFPGGESAWIRFVEKNLIYPKKARRKKIEGTVIVQLVINKQGYSQDIQVISGPEELKQAAIDVVKKVPLWNVEEQGGRPVKSYLKMPVKFELKK